MKGWNTKTRHQTKGLLGVAALALFYDSSGWAFVLSTCALVWIARYGKKQSVKNLWWIGVSGVSSVIAFVLEIYRLFYNKTGSNDGDHDQSNTTTKRSVLLIQQCLACTLIGCIVSSESILSEKDDLSVATAEEEGQAATAKRKSGKSEDIDASCNDSVSTLSTTFAQDQLPLTLDRLLSPNRLEYLEERAKRLNMSETRVLQNNLQLNEQDIYEYEDQGMDERDDEDDDDEEEEYEQNFPMEQLGEDDEFDEEQWSNDDGDASNDGEREEVRRQEEGDDEEDEMGGDEQVLDELSEPNGQRGEYGGGEIDD